MCAYHCVQLPHTTQHRGVLIIFPLILQTIIIAQIMSTGGNGVWIITNNVLIEWCYCRMLQGNRVTAVETAKTETRVYYNYIKILRYKTQRVKKN